MHMCIKKRRKKVKVINHDCLSILMLLYVLCIMLAYLMLYTALSDAVCLRNAFLPLIFASAFCFHALSYLVYWHVVCLFHVLFCIMHRKKVLLICWFFLILCSHRERAMCSLEK